MVVTAYGSGVGSQSGGFPVTERRKWRNYDLNSEISS